MKTEIISAQDPLALRRAHEILQSGGLVAFPTDTVYGVGALAFNARAVESIYAVKDRPAERAIPVLIGDLDDLAKVSYEVPEIALKLAARFWPGPLTLVVPKHPEIPEAVSSIATIGVRIPNHEVARALLCLVGPMAATSANLSSQPNSHTAQEVLAQLGGRIALILDGGKTPGGIPSTVVDCVGAEPLVLRAGPISRSEILVVSGQDL
jgi:L-threonylcarbamoyladenylate synthase